MKSIHKISITPCLPWFYPHQLFASKKREKGRRKKGRRKKERRDKERREREREREEKGKKEKRIFFQTDQRQVN